MIYYEYSTDKKTHQFENTTFLKYSNIYNIPINYYIYIFLSFLPYFFFFSVSTMHAFLCKSLGLMMSQLTTAAARGIYIYWSKPLTSNAHTHQSSYTTHTRYILIKHLQPSLIFSTPKYGKPCQKPSHIGFKNRHHRSWSKRHSSCETAITP